MTGAIVIDEFKPLNAGAMIGVATLTMPSGMKLHDCGIFCKDGRAWASPPSKRMIGRDGMVMLNTNGKARYEPTVSFVDRTTHDKWSDAVIDALRRAHPEALS